MRTIRNELGEVVEDQPTASELSKALDSACEYLERLTAAITPNYIRHASEWRKGFIEEAQSERLPNY